ncbi:MAG: P-type conjugative transfer protein TrbJ [Hyphomonas sp.]|uniref:P-type conjugative transfer protein TrbJ n=1 Tax=Hyphomonas sp. TaxID=87 RepID=UPI0017A498CD|nr:P-type conjugative transfer protein TrbJ [Hyphomonas sp.]MBU3919339.1 P-type conjugative transfer protein TrbJ [Alphaproteobacteria bacterium]MBA3069126.1 P-type conjugative transfer protein TrbJ [Hyphomonas sp.]MBU4061541.1 P-type conjugative transfer protein TrbJ [Alphaproteobacteria bacterium]MBU4165399.1 P-type conjugative transfer protein TrbJ [Alphaproteobacteria bacterium]MBU4567791.1 P-type conjugative transfer protein TrbJ [Alphaproteobacteria bacterium]
MKYLEICLTVLLSPVLVSLPDLAFPRPAAAQVAVYDPANHAQNILQAVRALQELENQIQQLTHEIDMIEKMARDLETLPVNVAGALLRERIARIEALIREADGTLASAEAIRQGFDAAYPESYGETPPSASVLLADARARWEASRAAHKQMLLVEAATRADSAADADALAGLVAESQSAAGNLQALQAGNQMTALTAQQLMQMEAILGADARAQALETARTLAEAERGRARLKSFLGN